MKTNTKQPGVSRLLFDSRDVELIRIINAVCCSDTDLDYARRQYYGHFHPNGIKEMTESRSLRIAYAMVHLLTSLESGRMDDRLAALQSLKDEVLDTAGGPLPRNTARALLQIMKELIRSRGNEYNQFRLAHDFRMTASGRPRVVRKQLRRYHLLEMPEAWNQIAFDDHVHDVNTKGRKSPTHLIMDAWIKGIRRLRVVHYNYVEPRSAAELMEAARIMEIDTRIGIEFSALFRNRYVQLIWAPRGFPDAQAVLCFMEEPAVSDLVRQGRAVSAYQQNYVMALLDAFNRNHLPRINRQFGIDMTPVGRKEFLQFVGTGQKSRLHLEKLIGERLIAALSEKSDTLKAGMEAAGEDERDQAHAWFSELRRLDPEEMIENFLAPASNRDIPDPSVPGEDTRPDLLKITPQALLNRLAGLKSGYRITLNLSNLSAADVLELLYDCNGMISRLEIFNLKDWADGKTGNIPAISRLQETINLQNPIAIKQVIVDIIETVKKTDVASGIGHDRLEKLDDILHDIGGLQAMYKGRPIKARIGSDSTGRTARIHGMGLAVVDTLPRRTRRLLAEDVGVRREIIPMQITVHRRTTHMPRPEPGRFWQPQNGLNTTPSFQGRFGSNRVDDWAVVSEATRMKQPGNIVTLGGIQKETDIRQISGQPENRGVRPRLAWSYLNSNLRNALKVLLGFIPAFATFALTKEWWLLAYGGAFIWFGITGLRNIIQSILGGGGLQRSPLLRWNAYVSWDRIADSLLYTGFSVPLLDYLVKTVLLDRTFAVNTATHPIVLYSVMALVNGIYISGHNAFRGLPKGAIFGNFFRSVLSIPLAIAANYGLAGLLPAFGVNQVEAVLQRWAAIISKAASDSVAGIIEGAADRSANIHMRFRDYRKKLSLVIHIYAQLELLMPEFKTFEILSQQRRFREKANAEALSLEHILTIHALDLLYYWYYQPRARTALKALLEAISDEERHILIAVQATLQQKRKISQMFIDGVLGDDFARALAFYLSRHEEYLSNLKEIGR